HHIILDGWSTGLVLTDLAAIYQALEDEIEVALPHRPAFSGFVQWLERQEPAPAQRYWRSVLAGCAEPSRLPRMPTPVSSDAAGAGRRRSGACLATAVRRAGGRALIDHLVVFESYPMDAAPRALSGADGRALQVRSVLARERTDYDLAVVVTPGRRWALRFIY